MTESTARFDQLIQEALSQEMLGWDFSWLNARTREAPLPWDYAQIIRGHMASSTAMLDLGTGGGELLASLAPLPPLTCATEGYPPNVIVARQRLAPLGVQVADVSALQEDRLPYPGASFDLVTDRHTGCDPAELYRVLQPGGRYITQQVGGENCMDFNRLLQEEPSYMYAHVLLPSYTQQLEQAGLRIVDAGEAFSEWTFMDIAGVIFFLKIVSWQIDDFSVEKYREKLWVLHQRIEREGGLTVKEHRFLVEAVKDR